MPIFESGQLRIHYAVHGDGFPLLLLAPGGMRSTIAAWSRASWNPIDVLAGDYRVIAMDQRNSGGSSAPISADDGWHSYTDDQLALLDHLGIERCHALGMCIGGPYCLGLIERAPERIAAAVLMQPIGRSADNARAFEQLFDGWADALRKSRPDIDDATWHQFRNHMFGGEFLFNVSRDFVQRCRHPLLVLMGDDPYHPQAISREIAALAPNAELIEQWKTPHQDAAIERVKAFLAAHTPGAAAG